MDKDLLSRIRLDSLSKHDGATKKYGSIPLESCKTLAVNRDIKSNQYKVAFEEIDGWCHGVNVPSDWLKPDHISSDRMGCPRCGGAGKLTAYGIDCSECSGTGMIPKVKNP